MSTDIDWREEIGPQVRTLQIVVAALTAGCLTFMAIAVFMVQSGQAPAADNDMPPIITYLALGFAGVAIVLRMIVPRMIESAARKRIADGTWQPPTTGQQRAEIVQLVERLGDAGKLLPVLMTRTIIAGAILEGSAFFALIAYLLGRSPLTLAAAVVLVIGVALNFQTRSSAVHWIEDQLAAVEQLRQFGS
jgi:hypothetical protein